MELREFRESLKDSAPPATLPLVLAALWWDAKGDWQKAHECAQQEETQDHAWVHAYLHRKQGDLPNARYWYGQAKRPVANGEFEPEWTRIAQTLLGADAH
jgi:hypothetical protein